MRNTNIPTAQSGAPPFDISPTGEDDNQRAVTAGEADRWYRDITHEMFG